MEQEHYITSHFPKNPFVKDSSVRWNAACGTVTGTENIETKLMNNKVITIYNCYGQEVSEAQAQEGIFIYHYSDGTVKKILK